MDPDRTVAMGNKTDRGWVSVHGIKRRLLPVTAQTTSRL
jgi:hypothetical protein